MTKRRLGHALVPAAAGFSLLLSVGLWFLTGSRDQALFVGLWVPSIIGLGIYAELVAQER